MLREIGTIHINYLTMVLVGEGIFLERAASLAVITVFRVSAAVRALL